jgi:hypothetical protein
VIIIKEERGGKGVETAESSWRFWDVLLDGGDCFVGESWQAK